MVFLPKMHSVTLHQTDPRWDSSDRMQVMYSLKLPVILKDREMLQNCPTCKCKEAGNILSVTNYQQLGYRRYALTLSAALQSRVLVCKF